jgi:hypothetical protein
MDKNFKRLIIPNVEEDIGKQKLRLRTGVWLKWQSAFLGSKRP